MAEKSKELWLFNVPYISFKRQSLHFIRIKLLVENERNTDENLNTKYKE